jgi:nucleoside-diphosphate-sugar epimerase
VGARRSRADAVIRNGHGLLGMRERVELYGGTLVTGSRTSSTQTRPRTPSSRFSRRNTAAQFGRWDPRLKMIGLQFSNVMDPDDYAAFRLSMLTPAATVELWSYIDARDGAQAVRKALQYDEAGMNVFISPMPTPSRRDPSSELVAEEFPTVGLRAGVGPNETLPTIDKARRLLGYQPSVQLAGSHPPNGQVIDACSGWRAPPGRPRQTTAAAEAPAAE